MKITAGKIKNKLLEVSKKFFLFKAGSIFRFFKKRPLPKNPDGKVLIHIGCGEFDDKRFINVDTRPGWHIHYAKSVSDLGKLFPENYADLIYACMVLEHVSYLKLPEVVRSLYKLLKKDGVLRVSVPDFDVIVEMYAEMKSIKGITPPLMGGQGYVGNFHYSIFNNDFARELFFKSGFREVRAWNPDSVAYHKFDDWSRRKFPFAGKNWPISLNLEAIK